MVLIYKFYWILIMDKKNKKFITKLKVKLYELNNIREIIIDLNNRKDRSKLKHIIAHEGHRLRKRDKHRYTLLLEQTRLG